ncbi:MAG: class I SAM-dependent methyltransferase [Endomicrobium sp.]|jgi:hypothetical protein|nr:class I SAM-dependent methyltransferase [Endomicrobium sp.]
MKMADAKSLAQKIAFSPLTFQAVRACLAFGIFKIVDEANGIELEEIKKAAGKSAYAVSTLLEVMAAAGVLEYKDKKYYSTKIAQCFLYDEMTKINFDFVNDVCYQGAFYLTESFENAKPEGLKVFGTWKTVYEGLSQLPKQVKQSWFAFDHFYSDNAFCDVIKIILDKNPKTVYDVGANTGKFELALFSKNYQGTAVLCDLPAQLAKAKENLSASGFAKNCVFYPIDVLEESSEFMIFGSNKSAADGGGGKEILTPDAILMSQFLDCFSKEQIISILKKAAAAMTNKTRLYILEPFWDEQKFDAAKLSLTHASLYFTAIANGNSKMYALNEMQNCITFAGLQTAKIHKNIGSHEYTLLEVEKPDKTK